MDDDSVDFTFTDSNNIRENILTYTNLFNMQIQLQYSENYFNNSFPLFDLHDNKNFLPNFQNALDINLPLKDEQQFYENKSYIFGSNLELNLDDISHLNTEKKVNDNMNCIFLNKKTKSPQEKYINIDNIKTTKKEIEDSQNKNNGKNEKENYYTKSKKTPEKREDNKMIKIKTYVSNNFHTFINGLLAERNQKLCDLKPVFKEKIKKEDNIKLWNTTFKDIYLTTDISTKYKKKKWKINNKNVINELYKNGNDVEIIQALDLTFGEVFQIFVREINGMSSGLIQKTLGSKILNYQYFMGMESLYDDIRAKLKKCKKPKSDDFIKEYIFGEKSGVKDLCLRMKRWFEEKKGRDRKKK